ncbi:hypothetical protein [Pedobacter frigiditerrae]|uniref:hypothetical protein n=1 Tax=Pedobacter frigiditerrae TaxID=2530452 RepID=UPI00292FF2FC|nr:hypothetical protein [Pedobacter frigiditerrae]
MKNTKPSYLLIAFLFCSASSFAQKIDYKSNIISVDGKEMAKVVKIKDKESFGLTSTFELQSLTGDKLVIAVVATDFVPDGNNTRDMYYQFTFLTTGQTGIFSLGKLSAEKNFVKLVGEGGIVVDGKLDPARVSELMAKKGRNPKVAIVYDLVQRSRMTIVLIKDQTREIDQDNKIIGTFKKESSIAGTDTYRFKLPTGLVVATAKFTGGNSATNFVVSTNRDAQSQRVPMRTGYGKMDAMSEGVEPNRYALEFIARWLASNNYL